MSRLIRPDDFQLLGKITEIEVIATGRRIREIRRLKKSYGPGRWRKLKGTAQVELMDGTMRLVEIHWYEAHGIGKIEMKIKRLLD
ncbi:MAG: hypothetical protein ACRD5G_05715 [Candidatus Acidiferrales bacterium]